jgi:cytochrome b
VAESTGPKTAESETTVWDLPLRLWHWCLAGVIAGSLYTGLIGDISLIDWHMRCGYAVLGLVLFRLLWGLWGGLYARWTQYRPDLRETLAHFRGSVRAGAHTAPGIWLALGLVGVVGLQAVTGLGTSDFIFTDGPLVSHLSDEMVDTFSWIHHRAFWLIIGLISVHLLAHVIYALKGDAEWRAMFTGKKLRAVPATSAYLARGTLTALMCVGAVYALVELL